MSWIDRFLGRAEKPGVGQVRASIQSSGGGMVITTPDQLEHALRTGIESTSGIAVTPDSAMRSAAAYACIRLLTGPVATMPLDLKRRVSAKVRVDADDHSLWNVLKYRPNRWQTPSQFKRQMQANKLLRGFGVALIVRGALRNVIEVIPLNSGRMEVNQLDDFSLEFIYTKKNGNKITFPQSDIFYLVGLTLDGVHGVTPLTYARETIGTSLSQDRFAGRIAKNGNRASGIFYMPDGKSLSDTAYERLKADLDEFRSGGDSEGMTMLFEEGLKYQQLAMTSVDAQWIESRQLSRSEICMFFGVPPHMIGDTEKQTSFGSGLENQTQGFVTFTLEDELTPWEETIKRDLIGSNEPELYARFQRKALVRGDLKARKEYYTAALQWGWMNPDEVRAAEDDNPRADGQGEKYYDPPNTAGTPSPEPKP